MDIANLRAFVATAESASFSRRQGTCTSPTAISKRVAALETSYGARLFDRIGRRVSLTEAGQAITAARTTHLAELDDSHRALSNLSGQVGGVLRLGTSHHIGLHRLPPTLRTFVTRYPGVNWICTSWIRRRPATRSRPAI